ncbi:hypothetical protein [Flavobacterium sp.]|uniref:hypothetical protein n=1 Tax=Flavobacterium sp. TaxID=239 RepID=UPI00374CEF28
MNLFSKKSALLTISIFSATFLMSFNQNETNYGKVTEVSISENVISENQKPTITGLVRVAARAAVNAIAHMTPELEQMSYTLMGVKAPDDIEGSKNEKLTNLD